MCSGSGEVQQESQALQNAQLQMTQTLNSNYETAFGEQQQVLQQQQARLNSIAANPMGMSPQQLATSTTAINENTATAAKQAMGAAAAFAAQHGGADVGNGAVGQIAGEIGSAAAQSKAQQLAQLSNVNQATKQSNLWRALGGLSEVGNAYGGAAGTGAGASGSVANSSTGAGNLALQAGQTGWNDIIGGLGALGGLATAGANVAEAFPSSGGSQYGQNLGPGLGVNYG
jgi:hypothetical protein